MIQKRSGYLLLIIGLVVLVFIAPVPLPYTVSASGKVMPAREWRLTLDQERLIIETNDHQHGIKPQTSVILFQRGDSVTIELRSGMESGSVVDSGIPLATIHSGETERQLSNLSGSLEQSHAMLIRYSTGEKEPLIQQALAKINYAQQQYDEQQRILKRQEELFKQNVIAVEDLEVARGSAKIFAAAVAIAKAELSSVTSGAKKEELAVIRSQIETLQNDIHHLQKRIGTFSIVSPFRGIINRDSTHSIGSMLTVSHTDHSVLFIPVPLKHYSYLIAGRKVIVDVPGVTHSLKASVLKIDPNVMLINGEQTVLVRALVKMPDARKLLPGMMVQCSLVCPPLTPRQYLGKWISAFFD